MSAFLDTMAAGSRRRAEAAAVARSRDELVELAASMPMPRELGRFGERFEVIAEIKPTSPSEGSFPERDTVEAAVGYQAGGAGMISVLTEPSAFGGSLASLRSASEAVSVPVLAKDFLVDPYQVFEARVSGADGALVIARILSDGALEAMLEAATALGMFTLIEAFDLTDLARIDRVARGVARTLVGVNCRDLDTLEVDPDRHRDLAAHLPDGHLTVAESGVVGPEDAGRVAGLGYEAALVGSSLMRSADPVPTLRSMIEAGRKAAVAP